VGEPARGSRDHLLRALACRDGERHPGLRKGGALRGAPSERRPRSVRPLSTGSSRGSGAPATADVRRTPRRGTQSRMRPKRMHPSHARVIVACPGRRVLRSVLRPVHVTLTSTSPGNRVWWGIRLGITVGQTHESGRNQHWGWTGGRSAARRMSPLLQGRGRGMSKKRKEVEASVPARKRELRVEWSHVVFRCRSQQATSGLE
jgi:hypothetical protein